MQEIIPPIPIHKLEKELSLAQFLRKTNYGGNDVFITDYHRTPQIVKEIGRLREVSFRNAGGGTGKDCDLDDYDTAERPYQQLFVWNPKEKEITGGYRFYIFSKPQNDFADFSKLATAKLFNFSEKFKKNFLPHMIELGRSFVPPMLQKTGGSRKGVFALDNLWDGLGALVINNPGIRYFFGKVTMYTHFNLEARNMILYFLHKYFGDHENLLVPYEPLQLNMDKEKLDSIFIGNRPEEDYKILSSQVRGLGENIPPLINAYVNLSPTLKTFGTVINRNFGNVEETGIMITLKDMYLSKINRHLVSYSKNYVLPTK